MWVVYWWKEGAIPESGMMWTPRIAKTKIIHVFFKIVCRLPAPLTHCCTEPVIFQIKYQGEISYCKRQNQSKVKWRRYEKRRGHHKLAVHKSRFWTDKVVIINIPSGSVHCLTLLMLKFLFCSFISLCLFVLRSSWVCVRELWRIMMIIMVENPGSSVADYQDYVKYPPLLNNALKTSSNSSHLSAAPIVG